MKTLQYSILILLAAAFAGCATHSTVVVNQPVGPDLAQPRVHLNKGKGQLMVYSAEEINDAVDSYFPTHSGYTICSPDGKVLRRVDNRSGSFYQTPQAVSLSAGKYTVRARAVNSGLVTIPVVIEENKTTVVDLEGATLPQHKPTGAGQWVRLPNGQVVGMRTE